VTRAFFRNEQMSAKVAIVAAVEREVKPALKGWRVSESEHDEHHFRCYENDGCVLVCGGIGIEAARRAAEMLVLRYQPELLVSLGFAGALDTTMKVGDIFIPHRVRDARDGSTLEVEGGEGELVTFASIATAAQKAKLATAYGAQAVDMEGAAVARAARLHGIRFEAVKAISDDNNFDMPELENFIKDGQFCTVAFVAHTAIRPWLWPGLLSLAKNTGRARKTLCAWLDQYNGSSRVPGECTTRIASN
jgi:adenosylhomocysteine nucleosidase